MATRPLLRLLLSRRYFRGRNLLGRFLSRFTRVADSVYGLVLKVRHKDWTNWVAISGQYGNELRDIIMRLPKNAAFIDIGANCGIFSLIASKYLTDGIIISFEPNPIVYSDLLSNIDLNGCDNIVPVHAGIGTESAITSLSFARGHTGGGNLAVSGDGGKDTIVRKVIVLFLSDFTPIKTLIHGRPVLCKIDVERFEFKVLSSLEQSGILEQIDALWIEVNDALLGRFDSSRTKLYESLAECGFALELTSKSDQSPNALFLRTGETKLRGSLAELT